MKSEEWPSQLDPKVLRNAVALLQDRLTVETLEAVREEYTTKSKDWRIDAHFGLGLQVRNILRSSGVRDDILLDRCWGEVVEVAAGVPVGLTGQRSSADDTFR